MKANLSNWQDSDLVSAAEKYEKENRRDSSFYGEIISELEIRYQQRKKEIINLMKKQFDRTAKILKEAETYLGK